jgi:hypothetical protein
LQEYGKGRKEKSKEEIPAILREYNRWLQLQKKLKIAI